MTAATAERTPPANLDTLPAPCAARAARVRALAEAHHVGPTLWPASYAPEHVRSSVLARAIWNGPAASEFARPVLTDAADLAQLSPERAAAAWHHAGGAIIYGGSCCGTPASHRDALVDLARVVCTSD